MHHIRVPAEEFITAWVKDPMSKAGKHSPKSQLICDEEGVLYSYGRHFPLAKQIGGFTYVNMNSSTNTTNGHRAHVMHAAGRGRVIECASTLDTAGILKYKEQKLEEALLKACKTRDKGFLFNIVHDPSSLLTGVVKSDEVKTAIPSMYKQAPEGSLLKYFTAMLLKKPCQWPSRYEYKICFLIDAVLQTGAPGKFSGLKFIQDYHRIGAAAIAAQISSIDGGAALRLVNDQ